jgi:DNA-binding MarR family transcriptional regulator
MSQGVGRLDLSVGYTLKQAAAALRTVMDAGLRPLGLTVPQYACLELLGQRPGLSAAELARGAFVTRQSMHALLLGLEERGLLARATTATRGRALPTELTVAGRHTLAHASETVVEIERRMTQALPAAARHRLLDDLTACTTALSGMLAEPPSHAADRLSP